MSPFHHILLIVSLHRKVSRNDILSKFRDRPIAWPRQEVMYLMKEHTRRSLPEIGRMLERDHTTVLHGVNAVKFRMIEDPEYRADVEEISRRVAFVLGRETWAFKSSRH